MGAGGAEDGSWGWGEALKGFPGGVAGKESEVRRGSTRPASPAAPRLFCFGSLSLSACLFPVRPPPPSLFLAIHPSEIGTQLHKEVKMWLAS